MKAKLLINNQELEVEITEEEWKKMKQSSTQKETGYERGINKDNVFWYDIGADGVSLEFDNIDEDGIIIADIGERWYNAANYYSDRTIAENNARADKLMRQLRRFAVEHREKELGWSKPSENSFIGYNIDHNNLEVLNVGWARTFGSIYFDSNETARLAINTFRDELIWYFTEYKDSL